MTENGTEERLAVSADRLREAARVLRGTVDRLATDPLRWDAAFPFSRVYADLSTYERLVVHPGVGLALADWLDAAAQEFDIWGEWDRDIRKPLALADLILGDPS